MHNRTLPNFQSSLFTILTLCGGIHSTIKTNANNTIQFVYLRQFPFGEESLGSVLVFVRERQGKVTIAASTVVLNPKSVAEGPTSKIEMNMLLPHLHSHSDMDEEDLYNQLKSLERQMEFTDIQEEYVKDEQKKSKERTVESPGGGEEDPVGAVGDRAVHGDGSLEQRNSGFNNEIELLCEDFEHNQQGAPEALRLSSPPSTFERPSGHPPT